MESERIEADDDEEHQRPEKDEGIEGLHDAKGLPGSFGFRF